MKKIAAILMTMILSICMMPFGVFADAYDFRIVGPKEPTIENVEEWVIDCKDDGANPIYYDEPVFEPEAYEFDIVDQETETLGGNMAPIRPKMDCDIELSVSSNYAGNIYLGAWSVEEKNGESVAVERGKSIKHGSASISLKNVKNNEKIMLVLSLCGDFSAQPVGCYELNLKATATPTGDEPAERCKHTPTKVDKMDACCGCDGYKTHYECQDCWIWLVKDKTTGEFREMTKKEIKSYTLKMPAKKHSFTKKVRNANTRIRKASCTKAAKYYYTCKHCGIIGDKTFTYGKKFGHKYKKNYAIPATAEKNGKIGTICTRCKKVKPGTKTQKIYKLDSMTTDDDKYVVHVDEIAETVDVKIIPKFTVTDIRGKKVSSKYYTVGPMMFFDDFPMPKFPIDVDGDGTFESALVTVAAHFTGRYSGSLAGGYVETTHEVTPEWIDAVQQYIEKNFADTSVVAK